MTSDVEQQTTSCKVRISYSQVKGCKNKKNWICCETIWIFPVQPRPGAFADAGIFAVEQTLCQTVDFLLLAVLTIHHAAALLLWRRDACHLSNRALPGPHMCTCWRAHMCASSSPLGGRRRQEEEDDDGLGERAISCPDSAEKNTQRLQKTRSLHPSDQPSITTPSEPVSVGEGGRSQACIRHDVLSNTHKLRPGLWDSPHFPVFQRKALWKMDAPQKKKRGRWWIQIRPPHSSLLFYLDCMATEL